MPLDAVTVAAKNHGHHTWVARNGQWCRPQESDVAARYNYHQGNLLQYTEWQFITKLVGK